MKYVFAFLILITAMTMLWFLYGFWSLYQNQPTVLDYRTSIAQHNSDVSYPIFGAIVPTQGDSGVGAANAYFLDLTNGSHWLLPRSKGSAFTALTAVPDEPGRFLIVQKRNARYYLVDYQSVPGTLTILHEFNMEIRSPFMLGERACALHPTAKTTKQALDYAVVCGGQVVTEPKIGSAFGAASTSHSTVFLDGAYSDVTAYVIGRGQPKDEIVMTPIRLPFDWIQGVFSYQDELFVARWNRFEPVTLYRFAGDNDVEPYEGPLVERLRAVNPGAGDISWVADETVVITSGDRKEGIVNISVRDDGGQISRSYSIDLKAPSLR